MDGTNFWDSKDDDSVCVDTYYYLSSVPEREVLIHTSDKGRKDKVGKYPRPSEERKIDGFYYYRSGTCSTSSYS